MVRPTRSLVVTIPDIVGALRGRKMTKRTAQNVYFVGISGAASCKSANEWPTRELAGRLLEDVCLRGGCAKRLPQL